MSDCTGLTGLLARGNSKLGRRVWSFSLPAGVTCPGASALCTAHCYAKGGQFLWPSVQRRYDRNLALSRRDDFVARLARNLTAVRARVVRLHTSGDFYSAEYVAKWRKVTVLFPAVRFYAYTRSWRVPAVARELRLLARLPNFRLWYSCDRATGTPARVPPGVRLAWMQTDDGDLPPVDLVFRVKVLRRRVQRRVGLAVVCPPESGAAPDVTCARCGLCWRSGCGEGGAA